MASRNACVDPDCSAFFHVLDPDTRTSVWRSSFRTGVTVLLVLFGTAEVILQNLLVYVPNHLARQEASAAAAAQVRVLTML